MKIGYSWTLFVGALIIGTLANEDEGPSNPNFVPNDGDLENEVNPLEAPKGNYHIVEDQGVKVLNRDTFAHFIKQKELVLVEFYAPWCGHCKTLEPEYAKAAEILKKADIPLAKVDATKEEELAREYFVQGFPTILLFRNGDKIENYEGGRTSEAIVEYMQKQNDPNWKPPPSAVVTLTADNFTKFVKNEKLTLVMFYAPWCKHCKQILPEYEGAAFELRDWGISLAKIDGTREKEIADEYNIMGWPQFIMFRKGRSYAYKNGPREKDNIIAYMKDQFKPPSVEMTNKLGITNNMDRLDATVVGFFKENSDLYDEYIVAANQVRGTYKFLHTFSKEVADEFEMEQESIVIFQPEIFWSPYENKTYALRKKSATYKEIVQFIRQYAIPLVGERRKNNMFKYYERPLIVIYFDVNYNFQFIKDTQFIRNKVLDVAKYYAGSNLRFAISNEDEFEDEIKSLGLEDSGGDVGIACFTEKQKFRMKLDDGFESEDLQKFINNLKTGKVKPYMKSMPVPKEQDSIIKKVVADNYDEEIHKVKKDAVIYFYAPWCGHCKELDPIFKKVAKKMLKTNENIIFAKMDGTGNDIPYMYPELKGYPSIFFISAYEKFDPILYHGDQNYKAIKDWINRHSSIFLTDEEKEGKASLDDEEIESFTNENFEEDVNRKPTVPTEEEEEEKEEEGKGKDEL